MSKWSKLPLSKNTKNEYLRFTKIQFRQTNKGVYKAYWLVGKFVRSLGFMYRNN